MKKYRLAALIISVIALSLVGCGGEKGEEKNAGVSDTMVDLNKYYSLTGDDAVVIVNLNEEASRAKLVSGEWFIPMSAANKANDRFYWNDAEEGLIVTTESDIYYFWPDSTNYRKNGELMELENSKLTFIDSEIYVSLELLKEYSDIEVIKYTEPLRVVIKNKKYDYAASSITRDSEPLRVGGLLSEDILAKLDNGTRVYVFDRNSTADFKYVVTEDGFAGYVENEAVSETGERDSFERKIVYDTPSLMDGEVKAVWHNISYAAGSDELSKNITENFDANVVIPTWFEISTVDGVLSSNANRDYVDYAHNHGLKVWGLVDDFAAGVPGIDVLSNTNTRAFIQDQLVASALEYNLDGINIDFEYITAESAPHYIQFLRELDLKLEKSGVLLTICDFVPTDGNSYYNLEAQAEIADYICLMTYDEHYNPEAGIGSVASIDFVKTGIENAKKKVPANQLIMGLPFYTRVWEESNDGVLSQTVVTIASEKALLDKYSLTPEWNEECGQYYVSYVDADGLNCEIWLEEEESIKKKCELINEQGIGGFAGWALGYENDEIWKILK